MLPYRDQPLSAWMDLFVERCRGGGFMADIAWGKYHRPCIFILPIPLPHPPSLLLSLLLSHGLQAKLFPFPFPFYGIYDWRLCRFLYVHIILSFLPSNVNVSRDMSHPRPSSSPSHSLLQKVGAKGKKGGRRTWSSTPSTATSQWTTKCWT